MYESLIFFDRAGPAKKMGQAVGLYYGQAGPARSKKIELSYITKFYILKSHFHILTFHFLLPVFKLK